MLQQQLHYSGQEYQAELQAMTARSSEAGSSVTHIRYPVVIASDLELENGFMNSMREILFQKHAWESLPCSALTLESQHTVFMLISRAAASIHQLLTHVNSQFPFRLFQVLRHPERGVGFEQEPDCMKDPFTVHLQRKVGLTTEVAHQVLAQHASLMDVDISAVEARHASIRRRQLVSKSCQTWVHPLTLTSAEWIFQNARRNVRGLPQPRLPGKACLKVVGLATAPVMFVSQLSAYDSSFCRC